MTRRYIVNRCIVNHTNPAAGARSGGALPQISESSQTAQTRGRTRVNRSTIGPGPENDDRNLATCGATPLQAAGR
jgi:hypothetical protein